MDDVRLPQCGQWSLIRSSKCQEQLVYKHTHTTTNENTKNHRTDDDDDDDDQVIFRWKGKVAVQKERLREILQQVSYDFSYAWK